jgi:hypothetical protein
VSRLEGELKREGSIGRGVTSGGELKLNMVNVSEIQNLGVEEMM